MRCRLNNFGKRIKARRPREVGGFGGSAGLGGNVCPWGVAAGMRIVYFLAMGYDRSKNFSAPN